MLVLSIQNFLCFQQSWCYVVSASKLLNNIVETRMNNRPSQICYNAHERLVPRSGGWQLDHVVISVIIFHIQPRFQAVVRVPIEANSGRVFILLVQQCCLLMITMLFKHFYTWTNQLIKAGYTFCQKLYMLAILRVIRIPQFRLELRNFPDFFEKNANEWFCFCNKFKNC